MVPGGYSSVTAKPPQTCTSFMTPEHPILITTFLLPLMTFQAHFFPWIAIPAVLGRDQMPTFPRMHRILEEREPVLGSAPHCAALTSTLLQVAAPFLLIAWGPSAVSAASTLGRRPQHWLFGVGFLFVYLLSFSGIFSFLFVCLFFTCQGEYFGK